MSNDGAGRTRFRWRYKRRTRCTCDYCMGGRIERRVSREREDRKEMQQLADGPCSITASKRDAAFFRPFGSSGGRSQ